MQEDIELQPRFQSLFKSNEPPSHLDVLAISQILEDRLAQIFELGQQLAKLRTEVHVYETLLSGIRKLPPELLTEIFVHLIAPINERYYRYSIYSCYPRVDALHQSSPIVLSHVCRKWRSVALSTPQLWSTISVPHRTPLGCFNYANLVERCITHSRVSPLYITLAVLNSTNAEFRSPTAKGLRFSSALDTLDKFMPEISRWRYFHLDLLTSQTVLSERSFPSLPLSGAPNLYKILFRTYSPNFDSSEVLWALELLRASPNLHHILFLAPISNLVEAPWVHLQHFESRNGMRLRDLFLIFEGCPALENCIACFELEDEGPSLPSFRESDPVIVLSQLRKLQLTHLRQAELIAILQWLTAPSLTDLIFAGHHVSDSWPDELFRSFLARSACELNTLSLSRLSYSDANMMDYLRLPNVRHTLEHLVLDKWKTPISPELLNFLTFKFSSESPVSSPVLPKLNDVTFAIHAIVQAVPLREFFLSRWYEGSRNHVPFPVAALQRLAVILLVPYLPNATVSGEQIRRIFSRVEDMVEIDLETYVVNGGPDYPGIEKLKNFDEI
ncbi:hypothetical protein DFJ43DRAFT_1123723 [Lentinula guzmanii]|uniref:F-box domain-containing protein n=1 Tax=Lentinula guzmanii TaxID=2804957 RepID=A0AA38JDP9_9AGAR|nr:hypothetical protein DFJ43DRAFT_1123723 [Lentinula guzmanii]